MIRFFLVNVTGWAAVLATGIETALPYILRNASRSVAAQAGGVSSDVSSLRARMWPHYWLGYALVTLVVAHTSFVMGPAMGRSDAIGIWAATLALGLLFLQVNLGLMLKGRANNGEAKDGNTSERELRKWHFWSMIGFIGMVLMHLWKNG